MTEPPSDATSGDASSAGLRTIFDDVPMMTSTFMQLGSSEAMSGFLPMTTNAFSSMDGTHGLSGPPYSALNRRSTDHSQFGVDSDDLTDKALKKKKALQEKSKRAQRRYRERKKAEAEELKKQIEELSSRLSTLAAEKNQLQNRNSLLEKVVQVRGGAGDAFVPAQALDVPGNNVHDYVAASATFLGLVYPGRGLERSIRKEHMDNMTSEDYRKVWRDYINKLTHLLLAAEGDAGGAALEQIRELVESQRWAVQCYGKSDMSKLMKISLDVRREGSPRFTSLDAASKLMARLGLTMDQKFRIAAVRRQFVARLQGIQRGRALAAAALQQPIPDRFDDVSALQSFSEDSIVQEGHMQALICEQQEAFALAQYGIREILTPVQDARLLVDAFPQPPDPMLLSRLVAEELHDPSAQFAIEGRPTAGRGGLRPSLAPALDSTEFPPLPGDFFEPPPDHNNTGIPPAHTVTTGFI